MTTYIWGTFISVITCLIYENSAEVSVFYMGCFRDGGPSDRLFKDHHEDFHGTLTPDKCNEHCRGKGFAYAGTQYSFECFCSKTKPPEDTKTLESECNKKCSGDESKTCGGDNRLAVFSTGFPDPIAGDGEVLRSIGCFKDSKKRLLSDFRQDFPGSLTNHKCVRLCTRMGFHYAGTEYGKECYCGNTAPSFKDFAKDDDCSRRCEGDSNQLCGGYWKIYVFETSNLESPSIQDGKYIGCYKDDENKRHLNGHTEDFGHLLTPLKCTGLCFSKGFLYSGTQFSYQCFCGDQPPNPNSKVKESECYKPCSGNAATICGGESRNSIRETSIPDRPIVNRYMGCFDDTNNQIFKEVKLYFDKTNSPRRCVNFCWQLGYKYAGVEYGKECFCGNEAPGTELVVNPEECNMACTGDEEESCGASWRMAVYSNNFTTPVVPVQHTTPKPCEASETVFAGKDKICRGDVIFEEQFNAPLGDTWSHVVMIPDAPVGLDSDEYSGAQGLDESKVEQNYENYVRKRASSRVTSHRVKRRSVGQIAEEGEYAGEHAEHVEFLGVTVDKLTYTDESNVFGETIASRIKNLSLHKQVVAWKRINDLLLELEMEEMKDTKDRINITMQDRNTSASGSSTSTTFSAPQDVNVGDVKITDSEDYQYGIFTSDPKNSFTQKNRLVIKPTFINDTFVQSGELFMEGCTGRPGRQCHLKAASYNIIPPVETARIHTRNSFSFRYGIVEIRAKLPLGDWLVPELWLEPKTQYYGQGFSSGRIRIAMIRGNSDFKCNNQDFGSNRLESGVVMGPENDVKTRSLTTRLPENWHDHFHNYSLIWTPDNISFKIDNQQAKELVPTGRNLCEVIGFDNEQCLTWSRGSRIAPFDQDFYISLGISVANARDFQDECYNKGKQKPWRNMEQKAALKFWLDRENWKATWTEENSSLYVDHVRVIAL